MAVISATGTRKRILLATFPSLLRAARFATRHQIPPTLFCFPLPLFLCFSGLSRSLYVFSTLLPLFPSVSPCFVAAFRSRSSLRPRAKRDASRVSRIIYIMRTARGCACTLQLHTTPFCRVQC